MLFGASERDRVWRRTRSCVAIDGMLPSHIAAGPHFLGYAATWRLHSPLGKSAKPSMPGACLGAGERVLDSVIRVVTVWQQALGRGIETLKDTGATA